ncbi:MAG TPA: hypothetical protein VMR75_00305 [Candidatus Saccharimonadales bacterium]|nr:hypothetical protein [Candidatus Saccharimonadales bacterium]
MALTEDDKQEVRLIVREEVRKIVGPIEVRHEQFEHDIRGMFKDIKSYMDGTVSLRPRVEILEADVAVLKR